MFETNKKNALFTVFLLLALFLVAGLSGCAFSNLPPNSSVAQKIEAGCSDARSGLSIGQVGLELARNEGNAAKIDYYQKYLSGIDRALSLYCK